VQGVHTVLQLKCSLQSLLSMSCLCQSSTESAAFQLHRELSLLALVSATHSTPVQAELPWHFSPNRPGCMYAVASHVERCLPSTAANALLPLRYYVVKVLMNVFEAEYVGVNSKVAYRSTVVPRTRTVRSTVMTSF